MVGHDLSLPSLMRAMLASEDNWKAVMQFAKTVMLQKENAERIRREAAMRDGEMSSGVSSGM